MGFFDFLFSDHTEEDFFVTVFSMLGQLAAADGRVSSEEQKLVENFIDEYLVLSPAERARALSFFAEAYQSSEDFTESAKAFYKTYRSQFVVLDMLLDVLFQVAVADGEITGSEEELLREVGNIFKIDNSHFEQLRALHHAAGTRTDEAERYLILGCSETSSMEQIDQNYKRLTKIYDPDSALESGVPEAFINLARKKFESIEEAYAFICSRRKRS